MKICLIIILYCFLSILSRAYSFDHNTIATLTNLQNRLALYKEKHDDVYPETWDVFIKSGYLSGDLLDRARKYCDIEHRYRLLNTNARFSINGSDVKIVMMANQQGDEGNAESTNELGAKEIIPGRRLIIEKANGELAPMRLPEVALERIFKKSGLDLANFSTSAQTSVTDKKNNSDTQLDTPDRGIDANTSVEKKSPDAKKQLVEKNQSISDEKAAMINDRSNMIWFKIILGAVVIIILVAKICIARKNNRIL